jgi:hypothetical protein
MAQVDTAVGSAGCPSQQYPHHVSALLHCRPSAAGIVRVLRDLDKQARKHGGAVYMLNGNHESLNVCGDFRCVCVQLKHRGSKGALHANSSCPALSRPCVVHPASRGAVCQ